MTHQLERAVRDPERLAALDATGLLDSPLDEVFTRLARLAALTLRADAAALSLVGADREFALTCVRSPALNATQEDSPLSRSFCKHAVAIRRPLVIQDTVGHPWVAEMAPVHEGVRSYLGVPLVTRAGHALGALCVYGYEPRGWTEEEVAVLTELAESARIEIELRTTLREREAGDQVRLRAERVQALEELAFGLRHEINNALAALLLNVERLSQSKGLSGEELRDAQIVHDQAWRIAETLERLEDVQTLQRTRTPTGGTMIDLSGRLEPPSPTE